MATEVDEAQSAIREKLKKLTIPKLKTILRACSCSTTGKKAQLQENVMVLTLGRSLRFLRDLESLIKHVDMHSSAPSQIPETYTQSVNINLRQATATPEPVRGYPLSSAIRPNYPAPQQPQKPILEPKFLIAPLYEIITRLSKPMFAPAPHPTHLMEIPLQIAVPRESVAKLESGELRLMFLCANVSSTKDAYHIFYPYTADISLDGVQVESTQRTRGIKGIEGTTRPVDLTNTWLNTPSKRVNRSQLKIVFRRHTESKDDKTQYQSFSGGVYLVRAFSREHLIDKINKRPHILVSEDLRIIKGDEDEDVVAMQAIHSLYDPYTYARMKIPIRSRNCDHIDCVDAESFLKILEQGPNWKCVHCNTPITWDSMAIDDLMLDILCKTDPSADKVSINDDATWNVLSTDGDQESSDDERPLKIHRPEPEIIHLLSDSEDELDTPTPPGAQPPSQTQTQARADNLWTQDSSQPIQALTVSLSHAAESGPESTSHAVENVTPPAQPTNLPTPNTPGNILQERGNVSSPVFVPQPPSNSVSVAAKSHSATASERTALEKTHDLQCSDSSDSFDDDIQIPAHLDLNQTSQNTEGGSANGLIVRQPPSNALTPLSSTGSAHDPSANHRQARVKGRSKLPSIDMIEKSLGMSMFSLGSSSSRDNTSSRDQSANSRALPVIDGSSAVPISSTAPSTDIQRPQVVSAEGGGDKSTSTGVMRQNRVLPSQDSLQSLLSSSSLLMRNKGHLTQLTTSASTPRIGSNQSAAANLSTQQLYHHQSPTPPAHQPGGQSQPQVGQPPYQAHQQPSGRQGEGMISVQRPSTTSHQQQPHEGDNYAQRTQLQSDGPPHAAFMTSIGSTVHHANGETSLVPRHQATQQQKQAQTDRYGQAFNSPDHSFETSQGRSGQEYYQRPIEVSNSQAPVPFSNGRRAPDFGFMNYSGPYPGAPGGAKYSQADCQQQQQLQQQQHNWNVQSSLPTAASRQRVIEIVDLTGDDD